jgi:hypothetical protein
MGLRPAVVEWSGGMTGTVAAIDRRSITLNVTHGQGLSRAGSPPIQGRMRFALSPDLAAGYRPGDSPEAPPGRSWAVAPNYHDRYRATDVRVGDRVSITCFVVDGVYTCYAICIERRPGGRVPPTDDAGWGRGVPRYHDYMNAYQDQEEKGIPFSHAKVWEDVQLAWKEEQEAAKAKQSPD